MPWLRIGLFDDFKGSPALLLWGDASGLTVLAEAFRRLSSVVGSSINIRELDCVTGASATHVTLESVYADEAAKVELTETDERAAVVWHGTTAEFARQAKRVDALIDGSSAGPCHQFLDPDRGTTIQIIISMGEYPEDFSDVEEVKGG